MTAAGARTVLTATAGQILELVRSGEVSTRRELQEQTGLSRSTLTQRLAMLTAAGYLSEAAAMHSGVAGRPAKALSFVDSDKYVLTADLGATHARLALQDAAGAILAESTGRIRIQDGPDPVLSAVLDGFSALLASAGDGAARERLCGIGIGVPGPVNVATRRLQQPPIMPGWDDYPVTTVFEDRFGVPTLVDNDANLMGLGEARRYHPDVPSLLYVKVGTGIGAGLIIDGRPERGIAGGAGDIGHIRIAHPVAGALCACGANGCLAAHASGGALVRQLADRGIAVETAADVARLVQAGNADAIALVRTAGQLLGEVLATAVALLNPGVLVIGGSMALTHEHFLIGVRESLYERTVPLATRDLTITASALQDRAAIEGARIMVVDHVFSAEAVDAHLGS
ncbi:ROK family transcriptional regulator [Jiangella ureilytica]|uniref:ROK family transcriptional regulator n=1 Tax=Jiangella ureilytica TaxID=2530374 RepID=A0A4V2XXA2_9ACTN|nr:ROK family transcriptional regulator [Jiangella ureilytica]TDC52385.1 ROK family transcriptional regulator [Jiangella ureilytica]